MILRPRALPRCAALALACLLSACASLSEPPPEPASETPAATTAKPTYQLDIEAPDELTPLLAQHLDLARFQSAPQTESITDLELDRLAAAAPAQARSLLETEGYFEPRVIITRTRDADGTPRIAVRVYPGPRVRVVSVSIEATGELSTAAQAGNADAAALLASTRERWPLQRGEPFRQGAWGSAKNEALARLHSGGYPAASWQQTSARIDTAKQEATLELVADSGPLFRLGELRIEGLERHDASTVDRLATFEPGTPYNERLILDFQERLRKVGLFESASVEIDTDPAQAAATPVTVRVRELPLQQATVGIGISANTGPRVTLEHQHRKIFGTPWVARNQFEIGRDRRAWQGDLISHPVPGLYRNLVGGKYEWLRSDDEIRRTGSGRIGRTQDTERIERLYFLEFLQERLTNSAGTARTQALSANYHWVWRDLDSVLLPTDGLALSAQVGAGYAHSSTLNDGPFGRVQGRLTWYRPIGSSWFGQVRVEAGEVFANENVGIPDSLLFRAGGDDSVRGYDYRSLGPVVNGTLGSGRVLLTTSVELARPFSARLPSVLGAVFVDAGNAADSFGGLRPVIGSGFGVRWRSPVGPLRLDLAYGHEVERWRLHLSVGIAY
jgi:translocation and assembly module TamA